MLLELPVKSKWERMSSLSQQILAGLSLSQIAKIMGVSRQRVQQICKAQGIDVSALRLEREQRRAQEIRRFASQGLSIGEIANETGLTYCQVRDRAAANSIKCKIRHGGKKNA